MPEYGQPVVMGAPAGVAAPPPLSTNASSFQGSGVAHYPQATGTPQPGVSGFQNSGFGGALGNDEPLGYSNQRGPVASHGYGSMNGGGNEHSNFMTVRRIPDNYPVGAGTMVTVMRWLFFGMHALTLIAYFLSFCISAFDFSQFVTALFFMFLSCLFMLCALDLGIMRIFLDTNPILANRWASIAFGIFFILAYPYPPGVTGGFITRVIGGVLMLINVALNLFLLIYGLIGLFACNTNKSGARI
ncbi:hypothetical protein GMRT_10492 [Giardia muris]|uniref:Uncharacterized protein n=1 Tax=Giardia muris TaxID=5742 RepID=A0A4Z1T0T5_GIAMU|nr:hypothetical protein GMRT_10492 [Giardia muris]|eukprot:TNJ26517.1 hypothetical protein GMRT_10492 [Giardia muris]